MRLGLDDNQVRGVFISFMANQDERKPLTIPSRPDGIRPAGGRVVDRLDREYVGTGFNGYSSSTNRVLGLSLDEVDVTISLQTYEKMENDPTIARAKRVLITRVLADELQFAPGASEADVSEKEFENYQQVMKFCERVVSGLDRPYRETLAQILGNGIRYGHGIAEVTYDYVEDGPDEAPTDEGENPKSGVGAFFSRMRERFSFSAAAGSDDSKGRSSVLTARKLRLMPAAIRVKPRGATRFVVDSFFNLIGFTTRFNRDTGVRFNDIISREKFLVLTLNKTDEDPRGRSFYRPAHSWWGIKTQFPVELLRFVLEEIVPKAVAVLPPDGHSPQNGYEYQRDDLGNIVYDDPETMKRPRLLTPAESMAQSIASFRSGSGMVIPHEADLKPFKTANSAEAEMFPLLIGLIDSQMESTILNQSLNQPDGQHQNKEKVEVHSGLLDILIFWIRWAIAVMTMTDLCKVAVEKNFGDWAVRYLPFASLGDFVRRDWARDLEVVSKAYFYGFIDDTQRDELMAWLNLPKAGPSRQEVLAESDINGEPVMPNNNRPDKQPASKKRNSGNGTEKKNNEQQNTNQTIRRGDLKSLGHHGTRTYGNARSIFRDY